MERHLPGRPAHGRLVALAALCGAALGCVPLAPFERPLEPTPASAAGPTTSTPPDLPERGDRPVVPAPVEPAAVAPPSSPAPEPQAEAAPEIQPKTEPEVETEVEAVEVAPPDSEEARIQVGELLDGFYAAYNAREWKRARALFWDGATITDVRVLSDRPTPAVRVASVAEFFEELARTPESGPHGFEGRLEGPPQVRAASNVAQAWCRYQARFGSPQESMSWRRVDAFTFVLHEGAWKIAALAQSSSSDAPEQR